MARRDKLVTVCSECLTAACWYGEFTCDRFKEAGLVEMPVSELRALSREHPSYWTDAKRREVCGGVF